MILFDLFLRFVVPYNLYRLKQRREDISMNTRYDIFTPKAYRNPTDNSEQAEAFADMKAKQEVDKFWERYENEPGYRKRLAKHLAPMLIDALKPDSSSKASRIIEEDDEKEDRFV